MTASTPENGSALASTDDLATVVVTRVVASGQEENFRHWALRFVAASESFAGNRGTVVLSPAPGQDNMFRIVQRFTDTASLEAWEDFGIRRQLSAEADAFSTAQRQLATGLEAWFQFTGAPGAAPPRKWKMALVTFVVVYCITAVLIPREQAWLPKSWSFYTVDIVTNVIIAVLMTYVIMPVAARLLRRWLYRGRYPA